MDVIHLWSLTKQAVQAWLDDFAPSMGAALAYYTLFSIVPLLIIVIAVAGLIFGHEAAHGQLFIQLHNVLGKDGAAAVEGLLTSVSEPEGITATVVGGIALLIGATSVFGELQSALDRIWRVQHEGESGLLALVRERLLSFAMVVALGFLLLASLLVSAAIAAFGTLWSGVLGGWEALLHALDFSVSLAFITGLLAMLYKFMPRARIAWRDVWIGAAATALLFTIGKLLLGLYLGKSNLASGFGAAGSLVALLVWIYYSAQIFLLGAEFIWVYAHRFGSLVAAAPQPQSKPAIPSRKL